MKAPERTKSVGISVICALIFLSCAASAVQAEEKSPPQDQRVPTDSTTRSSHKDDAAKEFGQQLLLKMSEPAPSSKARAHSKDSSAGSSKDSTSGSLSRRDAIEKAEMLVNMDHTKITWQVLANCLADDVLSEDLDLSNSQITDTGMTYIGKQPRLQRLSLRSARGITDDGLKSIAGLTRLRYLSLANTGVSDDGLRYLVGMKDLEILDLTRARGVFGPGLSSLANLPKLRMIELRNSAIGGNCLAPLKTIPLEVLHIGDTNADDATISGLKGFSHLRDLGLRSHKITDRAVEYISTLTTLERLYLRTAGITDRSASLISKLPKLRLLDLGETQITDSGVETLAKLPALEVLALDHCHLNDRAIRSLSKIPRLARLSLSQDELTGKGLDALSKLHVTELWLYGADKSCIDALAKMPQLKLLHLSDAPLVRAFREKLKQTMPYVRINAAEFI